MTNLQLLLTIGIPSLLVLVNIAVGTWAIKELRSEMRDLRSETLANDERLRSEMREFRYEMLQRLDRVDADLRTFHSITGKLDGRLEAIERR
jgi:hypothetical protein